MNSYTVYYKKPDVEIEDYLAPEEITKEYFEESYVLVKDVIAKNIEDVYYKMQGEVWSPHGEARGLILSLGLSHTSMSIGDIVFCRNDQKYYWCAWMGFDEVKVLDRLTER